MNIVKFHGYWQDRTKNDDRPRVKMKIFILNYVIYSSYLSRLSLLRNICRVVH